MLARNYSRLFSLFALIVFSVTSGPVQAAPLEPAQAITPMIGSVPLGVGLEGLADWSKAQMFVDAMKTVRGFGPPDQPWNGTVNTDANGWPTEDFGTVVMADQAHIGGTYHLSFNGHADLSLVATSGNIQNQQYYTTTNTTTAEIVLPSDASQLMLAFRNTGGGATNIKLIRPSYPADTTQVFSTPFINLLAPFKVMRFMDFSSTNGNQVANWAERTTPNTARQTGAKGGAWEYAVQLANQTGNDIWINIPAHASDDYVLQLATLLHNSLDSSRIVYVEYSNEVWNGGFEQYGYNLAQAEAEVAAGGSPLNADGDTDHTHWAWRRVGKRLREISGIFAGVYGGGEINNHVRPVLASQAAWTYIIHQQLTFLDRTYGPPKNYIYAVAGAPYFDISGDLSNRDDLTVDQIFAALPAALHDSRITTTSFTAFANYYGLHNFAYEGGPGLAGAHSVAAKVAANRDPRMGGTVHDYLTNWYSDGGELFMYFTLTGGYGQYGSWGMTDDVTNPNTPKYQAAAAIANGSLPPLTVGRTAPGLASAVNYATFEPGWWCTTSSDHVSISADYCSYDYIFRVAESGSYSITIAAGASSSGVQATVTVNDTVSDTVNVPQLGVGQYQEIVVGNVTLPVGISVLRVTSPQPTVNLRAISLLAPSCAANFADVPSGNIFYPAISYLYCRGAVSGTDGSHFSPAATSTRAQFAKVVVSSFAIATSNPVTATFSDVATNYFAYQYIEGGVAANILSGFDQATCQNSGATYPCYMPNRAITRGQLTKLVVAAAGYTLLNPPTPTFNDVPMNNVFYRYVETAHSKGVINGYSDGSFRPNNNIRRDEMCQIVYKGVTTP